MSDTIKSDYQLVKEAESYAQAIFDEAREDDGEDFDPETYDWSDKAHEYADQSQHVIYTARAIAICGNCNTDDGEEWLEDIYGKPFDGCETFADVCTRLAFATLYCAIMEALNELIDSYDPDESDADAEEEE